MCDSTERPSTRISSDVATASIAIPSGSTVIWAADTVAIRVPCTATSPSIT
jgi:hypothetical protein